MRQILGLSISILAVSATAFAQPQLSASASAEAPAESQSFNELYSETNYISDLNGIANQTRLRHLVPVFSNISAQLNAYVGAAIDRNLNDPGGTRLVENAVSPQVGLLYRPFAFATLWAEYRQRLGEKTRYTAAYSEADPRFGLAMGHMFADSHAALNAEMYGEMVFVPRWNSQGIFSGYARGFTRYDLANWGAADAYVEWNEFKSPSPALGLTRHQVRLGARYTKSWQSWSTSLFVYNPWSLSDRTIKDQGAEGLLVIGGTF